ncbi:signal recognition particle-docking protein FtsY [candidate division WOR-3 bacterium RBG_13_43_14]|uniref:Signal recognition particle-docking protein FtsY n=1 Tax=candidate division WOR-3 bacterium RBG_13_43_14 TaxID=1802590 RepID=A0A1F4UBY2_UNCW3|nr:MAG: signal recognition particle-docking protein FtsY [candidate division WOR-3 bacterium RBG_13_43_14]
MFAPLKKALSKARKFFLGIKTADTAELEAILLQSDIGVKYTGIILDEIKEKGDIRSGLKSALIRLLDIPKPVLEGDKPHIIMVSGVNGSGKTTTVAKLANHFSRAAKVILASADTYRDAANEQLSIWADRLGIEVTSSQKGQDAAAVVYDSISKAKSKNIDFVIIDTAGRLHTRDDLMVELQKIERVTKKFKVIGPDLNLLTIDANLGQNSIQQAVVFKEHIAINGLVLTKFDGSAKGGAVVPISNELTIPVLFLGIGEGTDDLVEFNAEEFVDALIGD